VLLQILRMLHPFMPFVTEEVYHLLPKVNESDFINDLGWPEPILPLINDDLEKDFEIVQSVIGAIRNIRAEMDVPPGKKADVLIHAVDERIVEILQKQEAQLRILGRIEHLTIGISVKKPPLSASSVIPYGEIYIPLADLIDVDGEKTRLEKELDNQSKYLDRIKKKLSNFDFLNRAPAEVIEAEKEKQRQVEDAIERLNRNLESLSGW
jgi:valyl-tRNA synthetase